MSYVIEKFTGIFQGKKTNRSQAKRGLHSKRSLQMEPLEERHLLSVSWCDEHACESAYCGQEHGGDDDALLTFDDVASPPDIMDIAYSGGSGPLSFEEYCMVTAQEFLLSPGSPGGGQSGPMFGPMSGPMQTMSGGPGGGGSQSSSQGGGSNTVYAAVFVVDTLQDVANPANGAMSLRKAITSANAVNGVSLITFADTLSGTMTLNGTALPTLTKSIDVIGPGADVLTISGNNLSQIFAANKAGTTVTLAGMTLTNGKATTNGGAISITSANGVLYDVVVKNSETTGSYGGGLYVTGSETFVIPHNANKLSFLSFWKFGCMSVSSSFL